MSTTQNLHEAAIRLTAKVFLDGAAALAPAELIPVLHRWIRERTLPEVMIDVADYSHVHHGPGVMLVCHEADYRLDEGAGRRGILYARKRDAEGSFPERLAATVRSALSASAKLAEDAELAGRATFSGGEIQIRINDRLHAPNTAATYAAALPALRALADRLYPGGAATITHLTDRRSCFGARIESPEAPDLATLLERLT